MRINLLWFTLISEVLVNLSSGWIGLAIAILFASDKEPLARLGLFAGNLIAAMISLVAAYRFRKGKKQ